MILRFIGPQPYRDTPIAHLADVEAAAALSLQRDLRTAPTPISGGMRKALHKEIVHQNALRLRSQRPYRTQERRWPEGSMRLQCSRCNHVMWFDEVETGAAVRCDRCRKGLL